MSMEPQLDDGYAEAEADELLDLDSTAGEDYEFDEEEGTGEFEVTGPDVADSPPRPPFRLESNFAHRLTLAAGIVQIRERLAELDVRLEVNPVDMEAVMETNRLGKELEEMQAEVTPDA